MDATARFARLVAGEDPPLAEAALLIAAHDHDVDEQDALARLDALAAGVPEPTVEAVVDRVFAEAGFTGNRGDYYDADNSFLDRVLARRTGIPITLAVVLVEVGARAGVPLDPVGLPGHFLVGVPDEERWVDAFDSGRILDRPALDALFARHHGPGAEIEPGFLEPVSTDRLLARMLANLSIIYRRADRRRDLVWVHELRAVLPDADDDDRRALASALAGVGRFDRAAAVLGAVADPTEKDAVNAIRLLGRLN